MKDGGMNCSLCGKEPCRYGRTIGRNRVTRASCMVPKSDEGSKKPLDTPAPPG